MNDAIVAIEEVVVVRMATSFSKSEKWRGESFS
jgi:hypothetical protein